MHLRNPLSIIAPNFMEIGYSFEETGLSQFFESCFFSSEI